MSYPPQRPLASHVRAPSLSANATTNLTGNSRTSTSGASSAASPALVARIAEKKRELESLKELRDLSAQLAGQMSMLEEKLGTLSSGTEAVAMVLSNWHNVLRAINMASMKIPKPKDDDSEEPLTTQDEQSEIPLPQTLVRIPVLQSSTPGSGETREQ